MAAPLLRQNPVHEPLYVALPRLCEGAPAPRACPVCDAAAVARPQLVGDASYTCGAGYSQGEGFACSEATEPILAGLLLAWCRRESFDGASAALRGLSPPPSQLRFLAEGEGILSILARFEAHGALPDKVLARVRRQLEVVIWP
jgi:hypothetical protein